MRTKDELFNVQIVEEHILIRECGTCKVQRELVRIHKAEGMQGTASSPLNQECVWCTRSKGYKIARILGMKAEAFSDNWIPVD